MAGRRKTNAKGRSTGTAPFVMLPNWVFDSRAFRSLKPGPRSLLWELVRRHDGTNNGRIVFSQRRMAEALNIADRQTIAEYVRELAAKGFIIATRPGGFSVKVSERRATEWALTWVKIGDELPTKEFARWRPDQIGGKENPTFKDGKADPRTVETVALHSNVREFPSDRVRRAAGLGAG